MSRDLFPYERAERLQNGTNERKVFRDYHVVKFFIGIIVRASRKRFE